MKHLEIAKTEAEEARQVDGFEVANDYWQASKAHALIAIAESSHVRAEALLALNGECRKIAKQLEKLNSKLNVHDECLKVLVHDGDK